MPLNFDIESLYNQQGLAQIHKQFCAFLSNRNESLYNLSSSIGRVDSEFILELAPYIEEFIINLFNIKKENDALHKHNQCFDNIHKCKRLFIQRYALRKYDKIENFVEIENELKGFLNVAEITEVFYANVVMQWWQDQEKYQRELECAAKYAVWMVHNNSYSVLFSLPKKLDYNNLINTEDYVQDDCKILKSPVERKRQGFKLTDPGLSTVRALENTNYCIFCHKQNKDSCSQGLCNKDGSYKISATNTTLHGCPLDEKISEMNLLKSQGYNIAALAVITLNNPMCAATGHRICNDCMRSCIYQKQTPVNVPGIETNVLSEVLSLPYGFEIYSLLTRWNPLNVKQPIPQENTNYKVLVVGLGPAGFTMAHYLLNEGHTVVAIDGLKIESVPSNLSGIDEDGNRVKFEAIQDINKLYEELDERTIYGFGGVTEYGITVRWNKNYLKIIRLLLERRTNFAMHGGVRFASNVTYQDAMNLGFHHIALAVGSGSPNLINVKNNLVNGVRMASDFLMSLQLNGAFKADSIANLQIRLPIVVVGGGLTAIDTATEALHYYSVQVQKFTERYQKYIQQGDLTEEEQEIAQEFLKHARLIRKSSNVIKTLKELGGVKVLYRKTLQESPAYRLNYEELEKAFEEGVEFIESFTPVKIITDHYNNARAIKGYIHQREREIPAKTILIAAGTKPNSILCKEDPVHFSTLEHDNITILGDLNPKYSGSVVKAMASSRDLYPSINTKLSKLNRGNESQAFLRSLNSELTSTIVDIIKLTSKIYELIIKSPLAAKNFSPGQFYRLQNYEKNSAGTKMLMEGLALTGAAIDKKNGTISLIVLEIGASSKICKYLKIGEKVALMGPTGTPTEIPHNETVMLIGGGLGNAVLFSIGQAMRNNNCKVLYFAGYKKTQDRYKINEIEKASDVIVWACDEQKLDKSRPQDLSHHGNIIEAIHAYHQFGDKDIKLQQVDRVVVIGSDSMMNAVKVAFGAELKGYFKANIKMIASINSPMQCMMKEVCAQCLQRHIDPITGKESFVYSCFNQDQDMNYVDFNHLKERLKQNSLQEKITSKMLD